MNPKIRKNLEELLRPDERVLWQSGTRPFRILDGREGKRVLTQWIVSVLCTAVFLALVFAYGNATATVIGLLLALLAVLVLAPVLSFRAILAQAYFITNERVMIVKPSVGAYAIERADVDGCRLAAIDAGGEALVIGMDLFPEGSRQLRWRSLHPKFGRYAKSSDGLTVAEGLVFYHIERGSEAAALLNAPA